MMIRSLAVLAAVCGGELHGNDAAFDTAQIDSRKLAAGDLFAALPGTQADGHDFVAAAARAGAAGALVARRVAVPLPQIVVADVQAALTAAARAWRADFDGPLIGVAGSNGKTTVKEMLAAILARRGACLATQGNLNNHLGVPLTLLRLRPEHRYAVIEMGANHAGDVAWLADIARPGIGLITNAGAEHLEGFGDLNGVARAEGEMVAALPASGTAIINADDAYAPLWRGMTPAAVLSFGLDAAADVSAGALQLRVDEAGFVARFELRTPGGRAPVSLRLAGAHNVRNALCATAAALAAGASLPEITAGLEAMRAVPGRLNFRRTAAGAWLIDDSYNANPSSVLAALDVLAGLPGRRWLVLGDMGELGTHAEHSHREIGIAARASGVERLYTHGPLAALAAASFGEGASSYLQAEQLTQALQAELQPDVRLLIKGSRMNRLERVVQGLVAAPAAERAG
jgi:UDP-N-acetylmuramoyl-tripeptide--D-alanyl-D-alanine ligase